ncbi:fimbrial protein [Stenotrophomonas sp. B1-1]|uniref:fimbrial protein n=1 Tax=Stenotrophomonas sp. B1-1 TaxID=2710648 RepID=UPI0013DCBE18|nr:fimbrial protein [Stenotrophomonas sp. B1-1]
MKPTAILAACTAFVAVSCLPASAREQCFFKGGESRGRTDLSIQHPDKIAVGQTLHRVGLVLTEPLLAACMHNEGPAAKDMRLSLEHEQHAGQVPVRDGYFTQHGQLIGQRVTVVVPGRPREHVNWAVPLMMELPGFQAEPGWHVGAQPTRWTEVLPAGTNFLYEVAKVEDRPAPGSMQSTSALSMRIFARGGVEHDMGPLGTGNVYLHFKSKPTCAVSTPDLSVDLGWIDPEQFESTGQSRVVTRSIELDCSGGEGDIDSEVNVFLHLSDANDPGSTRNVLTPTPEATASGVAIQIRQPSGVPITMDPSGLNRWWVKDAGQGHHEVPLQFLAVRSGPDPLVHGRVGGRARFTLTYY